MQDSEILELLIIGDEYALRAFYLQHKAGFIGFMRQMSVAENDAEDIYQDAIIALIENARKGTTIGLKSSLRTYLFSIGKFMVWKKNAASKEMLLLPSELNERFIWEDYSQDETIQALQSGWSKMGAKCKELLKMFYYENKKLDEIAVFFEYENKEVAKSQKSRCLKQLKQLVKAHYGY
jgi:RNA polymerase sigma factor (sigma-70 family)